jgi:hypothetical protein
MTQKSRPPLNEHPLAMGSLSSWLRLLQQSDGIDRAYLPRVIFVCLSTALTSPLRFAERLRYGHRVAETRVHPAPLFILGHWRSGTTHLHNMLCRDENMGYVSTFQAIAPGFSLVAEGWLKPFMAWWASRAHPTRLIDNIPLSFDAPQEEEFAIANSSPCSSMHVFSFPRQAGTFFERYALFQHVDGQAYAEWKRVYMDILRKATLGSNGKRVVLKNPANTGRIPTLLELFPQAKFIHIYRNPYKVFLSTRFVYNTILPTSQVQSINPDQIDEYILDFYSRLMHKYLLDKDSIPPNNLIDVRFEDLEIEPVGQLRRIYDHLDLPGFNDLEKSLNAYLDSIAGYQKNRYILDKVIIEKVNQRWGFAFDAWGYQRL